MDMNLYFNEANRIAKLVEEQIEDVIIGRFNQGYERFLEYSKVADELMDDIQKEYRLGNSERKTLQGIMYRNGEKYFGLEITARNLDECSIAVKEALLYNFDVTNPNDISTEKFQEYMESKEQHIIHSATSYLYRWGAFDEYVWLKITEEELEEIINEELQ